MRLLLVVLTGLVSAACAATPKAVQTVPRPTALLATKGDGTVHLPPDLASVTIQFTARGGTPAEAGRDAAARANAIRAAVIAVGIPADSMPSVDRWRWGSWGSRSGMNVSRYGHDTTYATTETFTVRIRNLELTGAVIDTALAVGAQTIANINFQRTETREAYLEALDLATHHARENAEAMVRASGARLGALLDLSTEGLQVRVDLNSRFDPRDHSGVGVEGGSARTTVVVPDVRVTATVFARWEVVR